MAEFPLQPRKEFGLRRSEPEIPVGDYLILDQDPETGLIPYYSPRNFNTLPRAAANFEMLRDGALPFIIAPEGVNVHPKTKELTYSLLHNLGSGMAWKDLFLGKEAVGTDLYVISHHSVRYKVLGAEVGFGGVGGILRLQEVGAMPGEWVVIKIRDIVSNLNAGVLPLLPVIMYRDSYGRSKGNLLSESRYSRNPRLRTIGRRYF
jgi:hypothetical protein